MRGTAQACGAFWLWLESKMRSHEKEDFKQENMIRLTFLKVTVASVRRQGCGGYGEHSEEGY